MLTLTSCSQRHFLPLSPAHGTMSVPLTTSVPLASCLVAARASNPPTVVLDGANISWAYGQVLPRVLRTSRAFAVARRASRSLGEWLLSCCMT